MSEKVGSKYSQYLPRIFQQGNNETYEEYFLGRFLKAFEQVLAGTSETSETIGIEQVLDRFEQYFDPARTPSQFLQWLAGWVGLELEEITEFYGTKDMAEKSNRPTQILPLNEDITTINRNMIVSMVQLYKERGTTKGLLDFLQLYAGEESIITINEFQSTAKIGESRCIGLNTMVGSSDPCFFSVHAIIPVHNRTIFESKVGLIHKVIENEKPFYTNYILKVEAPSMRVGSQCRLGRETLLGGMVED